MNRFEGYIRKVMGKYKCTRNEAVRALEHAYMAYLSIDELEEFVLKMQMEEIKRQERKLNRKYQK